MPQLEHRSVSHVGRRPMGMRRCQPRFVPMSRIVEIINYLNDLGFNVDLLPDDMTVSELMRMRGIKAEDFAVDLSQAASG